MGMLKQSKNLTNLAPFTEALISRQPRIKIIRNQEYNSNPTNENIINNVK